MPAFERALHQAEASVRELTTQLDFLNDRLQRIEASLAHPNTSRDLVLLHTDLGRIRRRLEEALVVARFMENGARRALKEDRRRTGSRGAVVDIRAPGRFSLPLRTVSTAVLGSYEQGRAMTWHRLDRMVQEARESASSLADQVAVDEVFTKVYGEPIESMMARRYALASVFGDETVGWLDPLVSAAEPVVTRLLKRDTALLGLYHIAALPDGARAEVLEASFERYEDRLTAGRSIRTRWADYLRILRRRPERLGDILAESLESWAGVYARVIEGTLGRLEADGVDPEAIDAFRRAVDGGRIRPGVDTDAGRALARGLLGGSPHRRHALRSALGRFGIVIDDDLIGGLFNGWFGVGIERLAQAINAQLGVESRVELTHPA
jgi:hypothetical protein